MPGSKVFTSECYISQKVIDSFHICVCPQAVYSALGLPVIHCHFLCFVEVKNDIIYYAFLTQLNNLLNHYVHLSEKYKYYVLLEHLKLPEPPMITEFHHHHHRA